MKKVAIVYDRVNKWGGAERVLLALHDIFPEAPLYTSVYDPTKASWAKVFPKVKTSFLQKIPFTKTNHEFLAIFMPSVFESFDFSEFDLVISVTSESAKGIKVKPGTYHICYCLTPTRYLWSHNEEYFKNKLLKIVSKPFVRALQRWDKIAAQRPDELIAISTEVQSRIEKYYGRKSKIIFPPVAITIKQNPTSNKKYYLVVSRLVDYKKVDLAVRAFNKLKLPLVVIGSGRSEKKLKRLAGRNIKFVGKVTESQLQGYYLNAKALIMPQEEDFGIVAVEAQMNGVPVIAYKKGGALDTVIDQKTGIFFEHQTTDSLVSAIAKFEKKQFVVDNLFTNVRRFSKEIFRKEIVELIAKQK
jgi:glycosyltransferase involved in cell wall biosynthesis